MSAPSGIKVPDDLKSAFSSAVSDASPTRALVFVIEGETFKHHTSISPKGSFKDDIAELPATLPSPKSPASFAYRLDSKEMGKYEWMMITFVPDDAGVRAKMLQASSRAGLLKALGANNFKHDWFATSIKDLTPAALSAHLNHLASPPPLSASEAALAEVREAEALEAKRAALDPQTEANRRKAIVGLGGKFKWGDGVQQALDKVAERSDDGWVVVLEIPASDPGAISLLTSEACKPSQLASKLPPKSPSYTFYSFPTPPPANAPTLKAAQPSTRDTFQASQGGARLVTPSAAPIAEPESETTDVSAEKPEHADGESTEDKVVTPETQQVSPMEQPTAPKGKGRVLFIYTCPSGSPIKFRMVYSSGVRGIQQDAQDKAGLEITGKLETSDISDLDEAHLKSALGPSKPTHSSSLPTPATQTSSSAPFSSGAPQGGQATPFGGAFGRPRPTPTKLPIRSATQIPLPASEVTTPVSATPGDNGDSKESIRRAFDAFGPRVGAGGGGGFARPRPAGKR